MIATKHCDICDTELPPCAFTHTYECADAPLHKNHPMETFSAIRVSANPAFTNMSGDRRPDVCPDCFIRLCEALLRRAKAWQARNRKDLEQWKHWRVASRRNEEVREGANQKRSVAKGE